MEKNRVKLSIYGNDYYITTDNDADYVAELGQELDEKVRQLLKENPRLSITQAAVLSSLEYADLAKKSEQSAENLRSQIQDYLEDAARARTDAEITRREAERLSKELLSLRAKHGG
ncbi:MAG TPA: cell division protein ZapA [Clostridia bacterium]|nr:cell division protein ZapA [Clostridia bacterium]